jgi:signal transduction histidine kinase
MQIRSKLTVNFSSIVIVIIAVSFLSIYFSFASYRHDDFVARLNEKASTTADLYFTVDEVDSALLKLIDSKKRDLVFKENVFIFDNNFRKLYQSTDSLFFSFTKANFELIQKGVLSEFELGDFEVVGFVYPFKNENFYVVAGGIDRYGLRKVNYLMNTLLLSFFVFSLLVFFAGYFFAGKALEPISKIVTQVRSFTPVNLSSRLRVDNNRDELARLSQTINSLLTRIESAFHLQKSFVANASHELRNPLAMITSQIEVGLLKEREPQEYRRILQSILQDITEINDIVQRLMELANIESDASSILFSKIRPDEILYHARMDFLKGKQDAQVDTDVIALPEEESLLLEIGNERLLRIAFYNLIENAYKYSNLGKVLITFESKENQNIISFINETKFMKELDLTKIFEPFHRGSNHRNIKGHGVGLYLVKKIIEIHHASIQVFKIGEQTVKFVIAFPLKKR